MIVHWITSSVHENCKLAQNVNVVYINCSECQNKNNLCTKHVLSLQFSCTELVIQWTICRHIADYLVDAKIRASDKDSPVNSTRKYIYWTWFIHQLCQWFLDNTEIHQLEGYLYWAWVDFEITCHYLCHWIWLAAASDQKIWGYQKC